jgi:tRNA A58 N-methylase Trm61
MAEHVCPWWLGYWLASPVRRWITEDPEKLLAPYVRAGMTILEPGPGMGFFTLPLARMVGAAGRVVAVDIQPKMLAVLERRARKLGLLDRIETRVTGPNQLSIADLKDKVDFALVFAVVHEMPSAEAFFAETAAALKPSATMLFAEPSGHVNAENFKAELDAAAKAGLEVAGEATARGSRAVILRK